MPSKFLTFEINAHAKIWKLRSDLFIPADSNFVYPIFQIRLPEKNSIMFKIKTIPKCPKRILQSYQADEVLSFDATKRFEVKTKEKSFLTSIYSFLQTTTWTISWFIGKPETQPKSSWTFHYSYDFMDNKL